MTSDGEAVRSIKGVTTKTPWLYRTCATPARMAVKRPALLISDANEMYGWSSSEEKVRLEEERDGAERAKKGSETDGTYEG